MRFLNDYLPKYNVTKDHGYISMFTCNHDTPRPSRTLSERECMLFHAFLLTMPGVPFIYYGDEIGMRYLDVRTKEGGYHRTGSRTPMQWDHSRHYGFSDTEGDIYLMQDAQSDAPTVEDALQDPDSLWHVTRKLNALRKAYRDLQADGDFEVIYAEEGQFPFVYRRGEFYIAVNPSAEMTAVTLPVHAYEIIFRIGEGSLKENEISLSAQSFLLLKAV